MPCRSPSPCLHRTVRRAPTAAAATPNRKSRCPEPFRQYTSCKKTRFRPATQARDGRRHSIARGSTIRSWRRFARSARRCSQNAAGSRMSFFGGCVKGNDCRRQQGESLSMDRWRTRQPRPRRHGRAHRPRRREYPIQARSVSDGIPRLAPGACMRGDLVAGATGFLIDRGGGGQSIFSGRV